MMFPDNTKILLIDDMKTMRMTMIRILKSLGFTNIHEADDGASAWPMLEEGIKTGQAFQLIISDWNMPILMGIDLLRKVRSHEQMSKTPFILATAEKEKTQVMEAIKAGVSQYVTKPFNAEMVKEKLSTVYNNKAA